VRGSTAFNPNFTYAFDQPVAKALRVVQSRSLRNQMKDSVSIGARFFGGAGGTTVFMTIPEAFALALERHQAGRLADAEALYRQILAAQPDHADARHYLGVIAHQIGRDDLAVSWIRQSVVLNPNNPAAYSNLGVACRAMGQLDEAMAAFRRAVELTPDFPGGPPQSGSGAEGPGPDRGIHCRLPSCART
jgi:tetratricopeptide (TPR) repeat protein